MDLQSANYVPGVSGWRLDGETGDLYVEHIIIHGKPELEHRDPKDT